MQVILRGIDRAAIFFDDSDYRFFLDYLSGAADNESVGGARLRVKYCL